MRKNNVARLQKWFTGPYHSVLLLLFFVFHGWNDFYDLLPAEVVGKVALQLCVVVLAYFLLLFLLLKHAGRAALFTTASFFLFLFFGIIEKGFSFLPFSVSGLFIKLFVGVLLILLFLFFLWKKQEWQKPVLFINTLLMLLIFVELIFLCGHLLKQGSRVPHPFLTEQKVNTNRDRLPDVYLILLDEYAGVETLRQHGYNNQHFLKGLSQQGFRVLQEAKSNYASTVPSVASMLNGDFIQLRGNYSEAGAEIYRTSVYDIYYNKTCETFRELGYKIENYSPFPIYHAPARYSTRFIPVNDGLLLNSTIFDDLIELLPLFIARRFSSEKQIEKLIAQKTDADFVLMKEVLKQSALGDSTPVFSYLHLMMPHSPFARDSTGEVNTDFFTKKKVTQSDKNEAYLQYLVYTNKVILEFIQSLKANTQNKAVILLMSDHGSRDLAIGLTNNESFNSLNCIYFPQSQTQEWYQGITNVNQFRVLFSTLMNQTIPLAKDSLVLH